MASLATTTLTDAERDALDRFVAALERELGDHLHAVWLYGSRARGEPPRDEDSESARQAVEAAERFLRAVEELAGAG